VAGCCECGDEPSGSGATELVGYCLENKMFCNEHEDKNGTLSEIFLSLILSALVRSKYQICVNMF
jgi:hypothetical protein